MGKLLESLMQTCPECDERTFAKRIVGRYVRERSRILIWECLECGALWQQRRTDKALDTPSDV